MSWPIHYDDFFSRLKNVISSGANSWDACCPAHNDNKPSLSVKIGSQDKLIFRCHAEHHCSQEDILAALNLTWDDCFPDNRSKGGSRGEQQQTTRKKGNLKHLETYRYRDGDGAIAYEVIRYLDQDTNKKTFRQRRPNPKFNDAQPPSATNPEWLYNMHEVEYYPYRYPELRHALNENRDRFIFIVEGEKDVESLARYGVVATTNAMGAGKWFDDYNKFFPGLNVVVIPDEDAPDPKMNRRVGLDHARHICESLLPVAKSVRMLRLFPEDRRDGGLDVTDWLQQVMAGRNVGDVRRELARLVKECPAWRPIEQQATTLQQTEATQQAMSPTPSEEESGSGSDESDAMHLLAEMIKVHAQMTELIKKAGRILYGGEDEQS